MARATIYNYYYTSDIHYASGGPSINNNCIIIAGW